MGRAQQDGEKLGPKGAQDELERGRAAYAQRAWADAYELLSRADVREPLADGDLDRLSKAASLSGRDAEGLRLLERLYQLRADLDPPRRAANTAFWIGFRLQALGESGQSSAWLQRAQRLAEREPDGCAELGYVLIPTTFAILRKGETEAGLAGAQRVLALGERFADQNVIAFGRMLTGRALVRSGEIDRGLALSDEAMLAATSGELEPIVTGLIYCSVIATFQYVYALRRAREWTAALANYCETQPQLVPFAGSCMVYRAELMQLGGAWAEASEQMQRCAERPRFPADGSAAEAIYQRAEIERMRGELAQAEASYCRASELGREPQPGLALLRMAQGDLPAAQSALARMLACTSDELRRAQYLPAFVEIMIASGEQQAAAEAVAELERLAQRFATEILAALAANARGALLLAQGQAQLALPALRAAFAVWRELDAPYIAARIRVLIGRACAALGDRDGERLEHDAARRTFEKLGAARDLALLATLSETSAGVGPTAVPAGGKTPSAEANAHNLSARELEVLRLLATGKTNKAIAQALFLSEKTVDRHVSNIFAKLDVRTRAAATAFAYENGLLQPAG